MSYGRRKIFTDATEITAENVIAEVNAAFLVHSENRREISELFRYYRNKTKILSKQKETRENINHKIGEARPLEVVKFHKGYIFGEPVQYIRKEKADHDKADDVISAEINNLNAYMEDANKAACDGRMADWLFIGGLGYKMALPNLDWTEDGDEPPFRLYAPDPRRTFIVHSNDIDERPLMNVTYVKQKMGHIVFTVYTHRWVFSFKQGSGSDVDIEPNPLGMLPIVGYPAGDSMLGVFEPAVPLIDALNELQSNRMDDIVQYVNSFLAILGGELDEETYQRLNEWKTLCLPEGVDAKYLSPAMSQADVQTLKDDLYQSILTICGVPNRNGGSSTSDTGNAVIMRDGWEAAEARAKDIETAFKEAEKDFLRLVLRIMRDTVGTELRLSDIGTHFTRRNYENIATKSQVLVATLNSGKIHPELCFSMCGAFIDPESAYLMSKAWVEEQEKKQEAKEAKRIADSGTDTVPQVQQKTDGPERARAD